MKRAKSKEEKAELTVGPNMSSDGDSPPRSCSVERDSPMLISQEEAAGDDIAVSPGPKKKRRRLAFVRGTWRPVLGYEIPQPSPPDRTQIEQFMNESLKQWFRLEYLMDYDCQIDKLYCMICTTTLPGLSIHDVKTHILDNHPTSVYFSPAQKGIIIQAWINRREISEEFVDIEEEMDDAEEEESELDLTKSDMNDEDDEIDISVTESRSELKVANENVLGKNKYKGEQDKVYVPLLEEDSLSTTKEQQTEKSRLETGNVTLLRVKEKKIGRKKRLEKEGKKSRKEMHSESDYLIDEAKTFEKQDLQDATVLKEQNQPTEVDKQKLLEEEKCKVKEKQLLKEQKLVGEASVLEEVQEKAKMGDLLQEETNKAEDSLKLQEKPKAVKGPLLEEEKQKAKALQQLQEEQCKDRKVQQEEGNIKQVTVKEVQTVSQDLQSVNESIVKIEEEEPLEPLNMCIGKGNSTVVQTSVDAIKKEQEKQGDPKMPAQGKKLSVASEKQIIQIQQVQQVPQTPTVLGIGVPLLKMQNTPAPIIITRVSVLPEHTVITPPKPKPSASTSEVSKAYRVIAPKVTAFVEEPKTQTTPPSTGTDTPQWAAGIDPIIWEVSLWQGNSSNSINRSQSIAYQMRWRTDFLMDYNGLRGSVVCMYCCSSLTVLKESSIKRHIVQKHPHTSSFSSEEKSAVMLDWENKLEEVKKLVAQQNKDGIIIGDTGINILKVPDCDAEEDEEPESNWAGALSDGKVASWEFAFGRVQGKAPKDPGKYQHDRWKLEFLMDYTPAKDGLICMVCGVILINPKISTVKMHIQQKHPDTIYLSDQEKAVVIEEWEQRLISGKKGPGCGSGIIQQAADDEICIEINEDATTSEINGSGTEMVAPRTEIILPISKPPKPTAALPPPCNSAKRSYQIRWRTEFMMDYDCRRQGLICMVCGGTLATLKVSTIKRHIVQVHPYSVDFTSEERQKILEAYSEMALHYIHSEECFKVQPQEELKGRKRKSVAVEEA